jgi:hypothetical protein
VRVSYTFDIGFLVVFLCNHDIKKTWENVVLACFAKRKMVRGSVGEKVCEG